MTHCPTLYEWWHDLEVCDFCEGEEQYDEYEEDYVYFGEVANKKTPRSSSPINSIGTVKTSDKEIPCSSSSKTKKTKSVKTESNIQKPRNLVRDKSGRFTSNKGKAVNKPEGVKLEWFSGEWVKSDHAAKHADKGTKPRKIRKRKNKEPKLGKRASDKHQPKRKPTNQSDTEVDVVSEPSAMDVTTTEVVSNLLLTTKDVEDVKNAVVKKLTKEIFEHLVKVLAKEKL